MKKPDKNKMGRIGKMLAIGTALFSIAAPLVSFAKTDKVNTPGIWRKQGEKWQFFRDYGAPEKGWLVYEKDWYYQSPVEEVMETGWLNLQGKTYFLSTENNASFGHVVTAWQWIDGYCYYFVEEDQADYGVLFTGGQAKDGYYVDANGRWLSEAGGEPVYISGKGLKAAVSAQQVAGVSRSIPSGNVGQAAGVSRFGGGTIGGSSGGSKGGSGSSSSSGGSEGGSGSGIASGGSEGGNGSSSTSGSAVSESPSDSSAENVASHSNLPKEGNGKSEEKPAENPKQEKIEEEKAEEEKNVLRLVGEARVNQDVKLYVSKDIMDGLQYLSVDSPMPIFENAHRKDEPSYVLDREKQEITLPKSLFQKSKTYAISIMAGGVQPFHNIDVEVK